MGLKLVVGFSGIDHKHYIKYRTCSFPNFGTVTIRKVCLRRKPSFVQHHFKQRNQVSVCQNLVLFYALPSRASTSDTLVSISFTINFQLNMRREQLGDSWKYNIVRRKPHNLLVCVAFELNVWIGSNYFWLVRLKMR